MSALAILAAAVLDEENETINRNCFKHRLSAFDLADSTFQSLFKLDKRSLVLFIASKIKDFMLPSRIPKNLKKITEDFDYSKLTEEMENMLDYLEHISEEIIKMKVECAITNIDLVSTIDAIDFESKIKNVKQIIEMFVNSTEEKMEEANDKKMSCSNKEDIINLD